MSATWFTPYEECTMASKITKDGRIRWKGRIQKQGKIKQKLFDTKAQALEWEATERKADWSLTDTACSLREWAEKYLDHSRKFSIGVYQRKKQAFRNLFAATHRGRLIVNANDPVASLTPGKVLAVLSVQFETRGGNAANADRKELVAAWHWGMKYLGLTQPNPCMVEKFPEKRQPRYVPPEEDFWKAFNQTAGQNRVMLETYLYMGARRSEVFRLQWEDVDFANSRIRFSTRKRQGGTLEYDWLPMPAILRNSLQHWQESRKFPESPFIFLCEDKNAHEAYRQPFRTRASFMRTLCSKAGVKHFGFHAIRHLTASILYEMGQPVSVIQAVLRHKSPNTTAMYLRSLGLEETRAALDSMADRFQHTRTRCDISKSPVIMNTEMQTAECA
ncbi:tyrosine-type recombinase/integrase [Desulfovibrio sp. OttesenSCG-928-G15]|nr:tyrosine-type recombinase/integrase [Desulfovibrio sp. OttesenSCG-928-G15]